MPTATATEVRQEAHASYLKVFTTRAVGAVLEEIRGDIERGTGRLLSVTIEAARGSNRLATEAAVVDMTSEARAASRSIRRG